VTEAVREDGRLVSGRYRLGSVIGRGGMGAVWSAYDELLHRQVAVKEVLPSPELTPEQRDEARLRTMREARAAARLTHPSAVTVYDVVEDDGRPWIVMELLTQRTLADVLATDGPLPPAVVVRIGLDLLDALRTAHRAGVLHRDVKPANVMFTDGGRAVLTDFGIATVEDDPTLTATGMVLGSPQYMSPERARGDRPTAAADLWSLGATLFAAVEGQPPFRREGQLATLHAVITEQPPHAVHAGPLEPFIARLLTPDPLDRPTAAEAYEELNRLREKLEQLAGADAPSPVASLPPAMPPAAPPPDAAPPVAMPPDVAAPAAAAAVQPPAPDTITTPPSPGPSPAPGAGADPTDARWGRRRSAVVPIVSVLAALAVVAAVLLGLHQRSDGARATGTTTASATLPVSRTASSSPSESATGGTTAAATSESATSGPSATESAESAESSASGPTSTQPSSSSGRGATQTAAGGADVPAGFRTYQDASGFRVAVPAGWVRSARGTGTFFRDPGSGAYLEVDRTTRPKPDALADWRQQESTAPSRFPGYQRIRLEKVDYRGWNAADWEFTWRSGGSTVHVLNRNIRVDDSHAYALYWSIPQSRWAGLRDDFDVVAGSFQPAS
jgi:serine/threonine protein kinase